MPDAHTDGMPEAWATDYWNPQQPDPDPQVTRAPIPMPMADFHPLAYDYRAPKMGLGQRIMAWLGWRR